MSSATYARPETPADALKLKVRAAGGDNPRQFWVENDHMRLEDYGREYVSFSGFYGTHGPEVFAAAPEMAEALRAFVAKIDLAVLCENDLAMSSLADELRTALTLLSRIEGGEA